MKKLFVLMGMVVLALSGCQRYEVGPKPSIAEVEPALKAYLAAQQTGSGSVTVSQLSVTGVGDFSKEMKGWPVYGNSYAIKRQQGANTVTTTWHPSGSNGKVAMAYARRTANGTIECFTPEIFQNAEKEMNDTMQKAFDNIQIKQ